MKTLLLGDICPSKDTKELYKSKDIETLFGDTVKLFTFAEGPIADVGHAVGNIVLHLTRSGRICNDHRLVLIKQHVIRTVTLVRLGLILSVLGCDLNGS